MPSQPPPKIALLSWRPIVALYDTMKAAGMPDEAISPEVLAIAQRARATREFVLWGTYVQLVEQAHAWCGSDERLIEVLTGFDAVVPEVRAFLTPEVSVQEFYAVLCEAYDAASYPEMRIETRVLDDGRFELVAELPPHYRDARAWFVGNVGALKSVSRHLGLPLADVEAEISPRRGRYLVSFARAAEPAAPLPVVSRARDVAELVGILRDDVRRAVTSLSATTRGADQRRHALAAQWKLTRRERTVFGCLCEGLSNKEMAAKLGIALNTVEAHVTHVFAKAGVESRAQLLAQVAAHGEPG